MGVHPGDVAVAAVKRNGSPPVRLDRYKKNSIFKSVATKIIVCRIRKSGTMPSTVVGIPRNTMHRSRKAGQKCLME
jgi:hypothetical protein